VRLPVGRCTSTGLAALRYFYTREADQDFSPVSIKLPVKGSSDDPYLDPAREKLAVDASLILRGAIARLYLLPRGEQVSTGATMENRAYHMPFSALTLRLRLGRYPCGGMYSTEDYADHVT
jgi:hypothetical protein